MILLTIDNLYFFYKTLEYSEVFIINLLMELQKCRGESPWGGLMKTSTWHSTSGMQLQSKSAIFFGKNGGKIYNSEI